MSWKPTKRKLQYNANKAAKVGDEIVCPICGTTFKRCNGSRRSVAANARMIIGTPKVTDTKTRTTIASITKNTQSVTRVCWGLGSRPQSERKTRRCTNTLPIPISGHM